MNAKGSSENQTRGDPDRRSAAAGQAPSHEAPDTARAVPLGPFGASDEECAAGGAPTPDEAREWLKASGAMPDLSVTWEVAERDDPAVLARMAQILFSPRPDTPAA